MSAITIIINILAAIGLIALLSYVIYYLYKNMKARQDKYKISQMNPPGDYMQNTGVQCPDYWVNTGVDQNGNYICKNSFNIRMNNSDACNTTMNFTPVEAGTTWEYGNPNGLTSLKDLDKYNFVNTSIAPNSISRCSWINTCGPNSSTQGIWSGISDICNNPSPSTTSLSNSSK